MDGGAVPSRYVMAGWCGALGTPQACCLVAAFPRTCGTALSEDLELTKRGICTSRLECSSSLVMASSVSQVQASQNMMAYRCNAGGVGCRAGLEAALDGKGRNGQSQDVDDAPGAGDPRVHLVVAGPVDGAEAGGKGHTSAQGPHGEAGGGARTHTRPTTLPARRASSPAATR